MLRKVTLALVVAVAQLAGQPSDGEARMLALTSLPISPGSSEYRLGTGDVLEVRVIGIEELSQVVRVNSDGLITLPIIGRVVAGDLTSFELQDSIAAILNARELVKSADVTVFIKEYHSQPIYVLGAVNQPGQYMAAGEIRLLDALSMAGGLDATKASDRLLIQRRLPAEQVNDDVGEFSARPSIEKTGRAEIDLRALLEAGDLSLNLLLQGGDVIQVPEKASEQFYVVGDVQRPGVFPFDANKNVTVITAMSFAGGFGRTAKPAKARILREVPGSETRTQIAVNLKKVLSGDAEAIKLRPQDVLVIPTSGAKTFQSYVLPASVAAGIGSLVWAGFAR